jgi:hypothetical protein
MLGMKRAEELARQGRVAEAFDAILTREVPVAELALSPAELAQRGLVREAYDQVLAGNGTKTADSREGEKAFNQELATHLEVILDEAQSEIAKIMDGIINEGKWPNSRLEYSVMRYKPLSMTDEEFREELYEPFMAWRRKHGM